MPAQRPVAAARGVARGMALRALETFTVKQLALGLFLVVLVASIPFGGMRAVAKEHPTEIRVDRAASAYPFTITLKGAWQTTDMGVPAAGRTEGHYLIVGALVRTDQTSSVPRLTLRDALRLRGVAGLRYSGGAPSTAATAATVPAETMVVDADGHDMGDLPPDTTYGVYWVFTLAPGASVPEQVRVELLRHTHRRSSVDQSLGWFDPTTAGRASLEVRTWTPLTQTPAERR